MTAGASILELSNKTNCGSVVITFTTGTVCGNELRKKKHSDNYCRVTTCKHFAKSNCLKSQLIIPMKCLENISKVKKFDKKNRSNLYAPFVTCRKKCEDMSSRTILNVETNINSFIFIPQKAGYCNHLREFVCLFVC